MSIKKQKVADSTATSDGESVKGGKQKPPVQKHEGETQDSNIIVADEPKTKSASDAKAKAKAVAGSKTLIGIRLLFVYK